jgi:acyl phosphate:glycerol-3-phosphate acyltransferase
LRSLIASAVLGYLLGSLPTAYLLVRWKTRADIRESGSGNVGTLNSYQVSRSYWLGLAVLLVDLAKGALAVFISQKIFGNGFDPASTAGIAAVIGHNYPLWLGFRGGRGLAPAAGALLVLGWPVVAVWLLLWGGIYLLLREVNVANAAASLAILALALILPTSWLQELFGMDASPWSVRVFGVVLMAVILVRLIRPVREYWKRTSGRGSPNPTEANGERP